MKTFFIFRHLLLALVLCELVVLDAPCATVETGISESVEHRFESEKTDPNADHPQIHSQTPHLQALHQTGVPAPVIHSISVSTCSQSARAPPLSF
jgi:hypothetical protein